MRLKWKTQKDAALSTSGFTDGMFMEINTVYKASNSKLYSKMLHTEKREDIVPHTNEMLNYKAIKKQHFTAAHFNICCGFTRRD